MEFLNICDANIRSSTISKPAADTESTFSALEMLSFASTDQLIGRELPSAVFRRFASVRTFSIIFDLLSTVSSTVTDSLT